MAQLGASRLEARELLISESPLPDSSSLESRYSGSPALISSDADRTSRDPTMPILPWSFKPSPPPPEKNDLYARVSSLPPYQLIAATLLVGGASALGARSIYNRFLRRIQNAEWVDPKSLAQKRWIKGYVTSVGDADNFRLYHTPGFGWSWPLKFRRIPEGRELTGQTIHIRIAGVDAPEAGHFGRLAQPYAKESLGWLKSQIEGKFVYCQLILRDQYGRIVAVPHLKPRLLPGWLATGKCLPLDMLRAGWASVYEQAGAVYGEEGVKEFKRVQKEAQDARRGMWKDGLTGETPAEYKRRYREAAATGEPVAPHPAKGALKTSRGWLSRLLLRAR